MIRAICGRHRVILNCHKISCLITYLFELHYFTHELANEGISLLNPGHEFTICRCPEKPCHDTHSDIAVNKKCLFHINTQYLNTEHLSRVPLSLWSMVRFSITIYNGIMTHSCIITSKYIISITLQWSRLSAVLNVEYVNHPLMIESCYWCKYSQKHSLSTNSKGD